MKQETVEKTSLKVLCLEDAPQDVEIIRELLTDAGYDLNMDWAAGEKEYVSFLRSVKYDIILSDFRLPGFDAFTALRLSLDICPEVPFICVSGSIGEETAIDLIKQGAVDYVVKDRLARLPSTINRALAEVNGKQSRQRAEVALRESQERYRTFFNTSRDCVFITSVDGNWIDMNDAAFELFGYSSREELTHVKIQNLYANTEDRARHIKIIAERGYTKDYPVDLRKQDGVVIHTLMTSAARHDADGHVIEFMGTIKDITERKRAEREISILAFALKSINECVSITDKDNTILFVNQSFLETYGYGENELLGKNMSIVRSPNNPPEIVGDILSSTVRGGWHGEIWNRRKDGTEFPVSLSTTIIRSEDAQPIGLIGIAIDITERKRAEKALREREEKYRSIFENVQDVYYETLIDGTILEVSPSIEIMSKGQYHRNDLIGKSMYDFYSDVDERQTFLSALRKGGSVTDFEVTLKNGDGSLIPCSVSSKIQFNAQGNPEKIIGSMRDITKRKRAEEDVKKSEEKYRNLIDNMNEGIFIADEQAVITFANKALANIHGYDSPDKMLNRYFTDFIEPSVRDEIGQNIKKGMQSGELPALQVIPVIKADGSLAYVQVRPSTIYKGKQIVGTMGIVQDITERKRAEEELKKSEAKYRDVFIWAPVGIYQSSIDGKIITANKTLADMLGYDVAEDLINRDMAKDVYYNEEERQRLVEQYDREKQGSIVNVDILWKKKDGTPIWIMLATHIIRDESSKTSYYEGFVRDITERKQSEENIRMLSGAMEQSPASVVITDLEGNIEYVNPKFTEITGYTFQEALGQTPRILKSGDKPIEEYKQLWETITSGEEWRGEFHNKKKNGELYWESASISPIKDASGKITHYLSVKEDITEQKSLQTQLLRAQRMESIGTLASGVAHDLNNVLTPIILALEILGKAMPDKQSQKMLEVLATSAHRGSDIVKQILGFARGAEGENVLIQVRHIINEITNIIKETFPKSITIKADIPKNIWTIVGDPTNLQQLMLNLCVNARDAMPNGGTIRIKAENKIIDEHYATMDLDSKPGRYLMLSIEDAGCGMPPAVLEHIFEPFFTTKGVGKGTGLGLSTVHGIVKSHGGFINVYSEVGKGTTFKIYLPAAEETSEIKPSSEELPEMFLGHGELIMVVDDESSIQQITRQTLETYGYRVITASNGTEAIAHYASSKEEIALVLTDMIMPYLDGRMTIRALQMMKASAKIVGTSGTTGRESSVMESIPGVHAFLKKPYTAEKLLKTLHDVLNQV